MESFYFFCDPTAGCIGDFSWILPYLGRYIPSLLHVTLYMYVYVLCLFTIVSSKLLALDWRRRPFWGVSLPPSLAPASARLNRHTKEKKEKNPVVHHVPNSGDPDDNPR